MKFVKLALTAAISLAAAATQAQSTITYDWTETGSPDGNGSGTVTVDYNADSPDEEYSGSGWDFNVDAVTGTFDSKTITGLLAGFFNFSGGTETAPATPEPADYAYFQLGFYVGSDIYSFQAGYFPGLHVYKNGSPDGDVESPGIGTFTLTPEVTPEPGTLALAGLGLAGLVAARRRK